MKNPEISLHNQTEPVDSEVKLPEWIEMYEISGQNEINEHTFDRYIKNKEQDIAIEEAARKNSLTNSSTKMEQLRAAPNDKKTELVKKALEDEDPDMHWFASKFIRGNWIPEPERSEFRNILLERVYTGIDSPDFSTRKRSLEIMAEIGGEEIDLIVKKSLEKDFETAYAAMYLMDCIPQNKDKSELRKLVSLKIQSGLQSEDVNIQKIASEMLYYASEEDRGMLSNIIFEKIQSGIHDSDQKNQVIAAGMIPKAPIEKIPSLIKLCLNHPNLSVQTESLKALNSLYYQAKEEIPGIIEIAFNHQNIYVQALAIDALRYISGSPKYYDLMETAYNKIFTGLSGSDSESQEDAMILLEKTGNIGLGGVSNLIILALKNPNLEIRKKALSLIGNTFNGYNPGSRDVINLIINQGLGEDLIQSPLYKNKDINNNAFSRHNFEKTGSKLTLVGGSLKGKSVVRQLDASAFLEWQKSYENFEMWRNAGFDYVPIESILSYQINNKGLVDVFSGVLDLNLMSWNNKTDLFRDELENQKKRIIEVMKKEGIKHGHPHDENFCLRFFRNTDGTIDFKRVPRLYLIDFDQAASLE